MKKEDKGHLLCGALWKGCVLGGNSSFAVFFICIKISFSVLKYLLKIGILILGFCM